MTWEIAEGFVSGIWAAAAAVAASERAWGAVARRLLVSALFMYLAVT